MVARRLGAREVKGDGDARGDGMLRGAGALRWMPGRGGESIGPDGGGIGVSCRCWKPLDEEGVTVIGGGATRCSDWRTKGFDM